ncbi:hypothetical protein C8J57DRAFT_1234126 [Mycena rebaudengoi]|nr:hypothetical protein C8J57DRAFT_1240777 [Mycena rebaudengoi]KAJ7258521.1 hypothetical protein C8J57DRAFT_1234126 [Mycena rebaudengoi]
MMWPGIPHSTPGVEPQSTSRWTVLEVIIRIFREPSSKPFVGWGEPTLSLWVAEGDNKTALSLFSVVLDGFSFMDVHRWRADCMDRIGDTHNNCGAVMKAVELWKAARPLFERSSQMKDITRIDAKLAEVDSAVLVEYEEQIQHLSELHLPVRAPEEAYTTNKEEEEEELAQGSDPEDKGSHIHYVACTHMRNYPFYSLIPPELDENLEAQEYRNGDIGTSQVIYLASKAIHLSDYTLDTC